MTGGGATAVLPVPLPPRRDAAGIQAFTIWGISFMYLQTQSSQTASALERTAHPAVLFLCRAEVLTIPAMLQGLCFDPCWDKQD